MQIPLPETSKHPQAWRTPYASASTNRLSSSFGRIGPSALKTLFITAYGLATSVSRAAPPDARCGVRCDVRPLRCDVRPLRCDVRPV